MMMCCQTSSCINERASLNKFCKQFPPSHAAFLSALKGSPFLVVCWWAEGLGVLEGGRRQEKRHFFIEALRISSHTTKLFPAQLSPRESYQCTRMSGARSYAENNSQAACRCEKLIWQFFLACEIPTRIVLGHTHFQACFYSHGSYKCQVEIVRKSNYTSSIHGSAWTELQFSRRDY